MGIWESRGKAAGILEIYTKWRQVGIFRHHSGLIEGGSFIDIHITGAWVGPTQSLFWRCKVPCPNQILKPSFFII
jgi:hypothetical protein